MKKDIAIIGAGQSALRQTDCSTSLPHSHGDYVLLVWIKGYWKQLMRGSYARCQQEAERVTDDEVTMMIVDVVWRQ
jgi:hypothetical protein